MLEIDSLEFSYTDGSPIIKDLSYTFSEGGKYGILGLNGCGKTTLFDIIRGLKVQTSGTISLDSKRIESLSPHRRAQLGLSTSFQSISVFTKLTVEQNLLCAVSHRYSLFEEIIRSQKSMLVANKDRIEDTLKKIGLYDLRETTCSRLSVGQQKLLGLGISLTRDFKVLLLDEPVAGVQPWFRDRIAQLIAEIPTLVIVIEHQIQFVNDICTTILHMKEGCLESS